jgi:lipid-A-disaccharide synthase
MKRMAYQPWVGLPNILCRDFVVPELIQEDCTPERLAQEALRWLDQAERRDQVQARFLQMHQELRCDTATRATDAIAQVIKA